MLPSPDYSGHLFISFVSVEVLMTKVHESSTMVSWDPESITWSSRPSTSACAVLSYSLKVDYHKKFFCSLNRVKI